MLRRSEPTSAQLDALAMKLVHAVLRTTIEVQRSTLALALAVGLPGECEPVVRAAVITLARAGFLAVDGGIALTERGRELLGVLEGRALVAEASLN